VVKEAEALLERCITEFATVPGVGFFDGRLIDDVAGPISIAWGVTNFPTIFVLDRNAVIRHKNLPIEELGQAVEVLLQQTPSQKPRL
jgi:hypothetical protein